MSRRDVFKSLLRSVAQSASHQFGRIRVVESARERLASLAFRRVLLSDGRLTKAVAQVPDVTAATVSSNSGQLRVDAVFHDGDSLLVSFTPVGSAFAPRGAKELSMRAEPESAANDPRCGDVFAAIASEVAIALWGPFLLNHKSGARRALSQRHGNVFVVDLRSIGAVRSALAQPLTASAIEAVGVRTLEVTPGGLRVVPNVGNTY
jgi:hypothetical protein